MKIAEAQTIACLHGGTTTKRAEAIATELRAADLLPKGGRGPYAPEASLHEIAIYLLAVAGAERVADAATDAIRLAAIENADGCSLVDAMADALSSVKNTLAIRHIRVMAHIPMAEITYRTPAQPDHCGQFFVKELWETPNFNPDAQGQGFVGRIGHIGGAALHQAALMLADENDSGELVG